MKMKDRLSDLPENLIHHIMSFLPRKETGKFCVLSKTLSSVWLSFPALHLDSTVQRDRREDAFLDYTRASLGRCRAHPKPLQSLSFRLYVYRANGCDFSTVLDSTAEVLEDLASFALDKSVSSLRLCCEGDSGNFEIPLFVQYGTPRAFSSAVFSSRTIRKIYLRGLNFASSVLTVSCPLIEDFALCVCSGMRSVEFSSAAKLLKSIEIYKCHGFERIRVMDGLASLRSFSYTGFSTEPCKLDFDLASCESLEFLRLSENPEITGKWLRDNVAEWPSLETFILDHCENVQTVRVDNQSLKCLELGYCKSLAKIDVAVPDLECFRYKASLVRRGEHKRCEINIGGCTRLKTLEMTGAAVSRKWIEDNLAPGLSFLEDLKLNSCDFASVNTFKTRFCFENLTSFQLVDPCSLAWLEIECPNLASFNYSGKVIPSIPVVISSSLKNAEIGFDGHSIPESEKKDFQRHLKNFISFFSRCNTLFLQVHNSKDNLIIPEQVRKDLIHTSNELKHLQIPHRCLEETENVVDFVDSLLWLAHHPETISFVKGYTNPEAKSLIKLRYRHGDASEVSSEDEEDGFTCCSSSGSVKCWLHDLTEVIVENFGDRHAEILQGYFSENTKARISVVSEGQQRFSLLLMMSKITNWFYGN